jgi:hypothetical protein
VTTGFKKGDVLVLNSDLEEYSSGDGMDPQPDEPYVTDVSEHEYTGKLQHNSISRLIYIIELVMGPKYFSFIKKYVKEREEIFFKMQGEDSDPYLRQISAGPTNLDSNSIDAFCASFTDEFVYGKTNDLIISAGKDFTMIWVCKLLSILCA